MSHPVPESDKNKTECCTLVCCMTEWRIRAFRMMGLRNSMVLGKSNYLLSVSGSNSHLALGKDSFRCLELDKNILYLELDIHNSALNRLVCHNPFRMGLDKNNHLAWYRK